MNIARQYKLHKLGVEIPNKSLMVILFVEKIFSKLKRATLEGYPGIFYVDMDKIVGKRLYFEIIECEELFHYKWHEFGEHILSLGIDRKEIDDFMLYFINTKLNVHLKNVEAFGKIKNDDMEKDYIPL